MLTLLKRSLNLKNLNSAGIGHHALIALMVITGFAAFGAYRVFSSSAATNYSIGLRETRPVRDSPELVSGCWLAGRVWDEKAAAAEKCKDTCRITGTVLVPRDVKTDRPAYCKGHVAIANENTTQKSCNKQHRWWITNLGCARKANQERNANAKRHCPDLRFPAYKADTKVDRCVAIKNSTPPDIPDTDDPVIPNDPTDGLPFFQQLHNSRLNGTRVFQIAPPPRDNSTDTLSKFKFWPATDIATSSTKAITDSTWTGGNKWFFAWSNRSSGATAWNKKPNPLTPPTVKILPKADEGVTDCRAVFTTVERANAATRVQIRFALGMSRAEYMQPWLSLPGTSVNDFVTDSNFRTDADNPVTGVRGNVPKKYCTTLTQWLGVDYTVMTDKVLLPPASMSGSAQHTGVVLDYEVGDSRSPGVTEAFIKAVAADVHSKNKKLILMTNPLNAPTQPHHGLTGTNLPRILDVVDYITVFAWSGNEEGSIPESYKNQLALLGPLNKSDYKKLIIFFELGVPGTTTDDAKWVYKKLHEPGQTHPTAIMFWRYWAEQGDPTATHTNQKINLSLFNRAE